MTMPRAHLVDPAITRWYHCVTRCVRRAFLLSEGPINRREWIEHRLQELAEIFAVAVGGFSVMDNHLQLLVRLDPRGSETSTFRHTMNGCLATVPWTHEPNAGTMLTKLGAGRKAFCAYAFAVLSRCNPYAKDTRHSSVRIVDPRRMDSGHFGPLS